MNKTVKAYHPLEMSYHKFMLKQVFLLIVTGLPFFSKSFSFIAYVIGYPLSILLKNNEPITTGLAFLRVIHWGSGFLLTIASILFLISMILKIKSLSIFPDKWGFGAIIEGFKELRLHYVEGKKANFGKMNIGQKASAWVMCLAMLLLMITGILLVFKNLDPVMFTKSTEILLRDVHSYSFIALSIVVFVHIIFALMPSNKHAFKAMFRTGEMELDYVKEHHPLWYEKLLKKNLV